MKLQIQVDSQARSRLNFCKLRNVSKFTKNTYFDLYTSYSVQLRLHGAIKVYKPGKNFPMRVIVSTIDTLPYGISKCLLDAIQLILNKS